MSVSLPQTQHASGDRVGFRKFVNRLMLILCMLAAGLAISILGLVLFFLLSKGFSSLHLSLFTRVPNNIDVKAGGMSQSVFGTLVLLATASVIGLPLGILGGIYQLEAKGRFASTVRFFTDVLNGIPSIVIGIFAYAAVVAPIAARHPGSGFSAYAGGFALGILMVPTVMRTTEEILRLVPFSLREASLGLGATRWRTMWSVVLPAARGGVIAGIMLALARIAGETAPLLFTSLRQSSISGATAFWNEPTCGAAGDDFHRLTRIARVRGLATTRRPGQRRFRAAQFGLLAINVFASF